MFRRIAPALLAIVFVIGCAGPSKLAERSEKKLAGGSPWPAWQLAIRALDKEPGNVRARAAATSAGAAIAEDWERRIRALAGVDTLGAADQVLEFTDFRANAARYATIVVDPQWPDEEHALRMAAARIHYRNGLAAMSSNRPKKAYLELSDAERFVAGYRDAARLADRSLEKAVTRVAVLPFRAAPDNASIGILTAQTWRNDVAQGFAPGSSHFTRILGAESVERAMTVSQLGGLSRDEAIRVGRKAGAQRIVWGSVGGVRSSTRLDLFRDNICRRIVQRDADGHDVTRWVDIPIEVVARVRDVTVGVEYEVISTRDGASLARQHFDRATSARVVWTSYQPEGDLGSYVLVSEAVRAANPDRARTVESRWKTVCGDATTLAQVLEARRAAKDSHYRRDALPRFIAGAAFVFLEDLPPADDLAIGALARSSAALRDDLARLDAVDDVDLGVSVTDAGDR